MKMKTCKDKTFTILLQNLYKNEYDKMQKQDFDNTFTMLLQTNVQKSVQWTKCQDKSLTKLSEGLP